MSTPKYKILKPFYCYHPEIVINNKLRPAFWGVEWTIVVKNNPQPQVALHYQRNVETETEAQELTKYLESIGGEFSPWQPWDYLAWYLTPQYRKAIIDRKKRATFCTTVARSNNEK